MPTSEQLLERIDKNTTPLIPADGELRQAAIEKRLGGGESDYDVLEISLGTALTDSEIKIVGEGFAAWTNGTPVGISIKVNRTDNKSIQLQGFRNYRGLFGKLYITCTAQSGRTLYLLIGRNSASAINAPMMENYPLNLLAVVGNTTTNLGDGSTFTGAQFWCANYGWIIGSVFANRDGTLYIDQSHDGTNYDVTTEIAYTASSTSGGFKVAIVALYARIRFTNSAGAAQTTMRLYYNVRSN